MMEDSPEFRKLTPAEKVLWINILNESNLRGEFYKADIEWVVALNLSLNKVREARRKFGALGWLNFTPGCRSHGGRLATQYHSARWTKPEDGVFFAQMPRYTWEWLLTLLRPVRSRPGEWIDPRLRKREPVCGHIEVLLYAYLWYWWNKYGDKTGIVITKHTLQELTGFAGASDKVQGLADATGMLKFRDEYHKIRLLEFWFRKDPSKCADNARQRDLAARNLSDAIAKARKDQDKRRTKANLLSVPKSADARVS